MTVYLTLKIIMPNGPHFPHSSKLCQMTLCQITQTLFCRTFLIDGSLDRYFLQFDLCLGINIIEWEDFNPRQDGSDTENWPSVKEIFGYIQTEQNSALTLRVLGCWFFCKGKEQRDFKRGMLVYNRFIIMHKTWLLLCTVLYSMCVFVLEHC